MLMLKNRSPRFPRLTWLLIALSFLGASLAGCATRGTAIAPDISLACNTYGGAGTYSKTKDTAETVRGVAVKNTAFQNLGCKL